jgi:hypothetical protein
MHPIHGRSRPLGAAAFAIAALLALPGVASATHNLKIYKAEEQVALESDQETYTAKCKTGDFALDGMWRIDHADQEGIDPNPSDPPAPYEEAIRSTEVLESYSTARDTYTFTFRKNVVGRVQLKLFVTCLGQKTAKSKGHDHQLSLSHPVENTSFPAGTFANDATVYPAAHGHTCGTNQWAVSPGFRFTGMDAGNFNEVVAGRLIRSWPASSALRSWEWSFKFDTPNELSPPAAAVTVSIRCLTWRYGSGTHKHRLIQRFRPNHTGHTDNLSKRRIHELQRSCHDYYKGIVGAFEILDHQKVWYQGMDPRIKKRAYRFLHTHAGTTNNAVKTGLFCLYERTT